MPKAFVLTGGSRSQLGLLEQARALGHEVCVVDGSDRAPLLAEGDYFPMSVTQRLLYPPPPLGVCIAHRYPSGLAKEERIFEFAHAASRAVGLKTGPSYVQIRVQDGQPWAIEVGARLGGGKDAELAKLVTGFDAIRANVLWALGELRREDLGHGEPQAPVGQVRFVVHEPGHIVRLD
ncbi:MAG TPA: hypothetical protein VFF36_07755, partial [Planctomycetota bacterium]|nr:hypothetical protein [Planctomycetota bacterium]